MAIPEVITILKEIQAIHEKKNRDYSSQENQFENFERSAELISWFKHDTDKAFVSLIGTKLARLANLLSKDAIPENESVEDSFLDLATYCILWAARYRYLGFKKDILKEDVNAGLGTRG
jgi:hypothetical protein